jgi:membrane protein YdbS with pleckstrin-like domain
MVLIVINAIIMLGSAALMVVALLKIRSTIKKNGYGDRISPQKMVVHALAFILYVMVTIVASTVTIFKNAYYFHWLVCMVFADASFICLFFVLWHLGSKQNTSKIDYDAITEKEASERNGSILTVDEETMDKILDQ